MKHWRAVMVTGLACASTAIAQEHKKSGDDSMADCPMMKDANATGVDARGDMGMGFSHEKTTHHFRILHTGGAIEVTANDTKDATSRDQIRMHLGHIARMFTAGNFDIPVFVHDRMPDGAATMQKMKSTIQYRYEDSKNGGRVEITTTNPDALAAIHQFLRFQIKDHRTGDPLQASK